MKELPDDGSNRTFMELKYFIRNHCRTEELCSNRTFMELKFPADGTLPAGVVGSNRTFMELKFRTLQRRYQPLLVLIVPLWN